MLARCGFRTSIGTARRWTTRKPSSPPKTPKIAPEAPALITSGFQTMLASDPPTPAIRYSAAKPRLPKSRSASGPTAARHQMFSARWTSP